MITGLGEVDDVNNRRDVALLERPAALVRHHYLHRRCERVNPSCHKRRNGLLGCAGIDGDSASVLSGLAVEPEMIDDFLRGQFRRGGAGIQLQAIGPRRRGEIVAVEIVRQRFA